MATYKMNAKIGDILPLMYFENCLAQGRSKLRIVYSSPFLFTLDSFSLSHLSNSFFKWLIVILT